MASGCGSRSGGEGFVSVFAAFKFQDFAVSDEQEGSLIGTVRIRDRYIYWREAGAQTWRKMKFEALIALIRDHGEETERA